MLKLGHGKAILATFLISSLLHGLQPEITVVLMMLGIYSYVQLNMQEKLAQEWNACIRVKPCRRCVHRYRDGSGFVIIVKAGLTVFTMFHLAYLGTVMDTMNNPDAPSFLRKWKDMYFFSHIIIFWSFIYSVI